MKKAVEFIQRSQKSFLEKAIEVSSTADNMTIIRIKDRSGLAFYPDNIQRLIIKTSYYPTASREEEILAYLLMVNATNANRAVSIPEDMKLKELVEAEHIAKTPNGRYYLTSDGQMIGKGALELYPELKNIATLEKDDNSEQDVPAQFHQLLTIPLPPNPVLIKMMTERK
ncbi:MAG: hypothetical protein ACRD5H_02730 [Nitrososphaerales archaeon]